MANPATIGPNEVSRHLLNAAADRSKRSVGVQLPVRFVRSDNALEPPPLARILRGGRGGEVRLKVYLTITMMATAVPYRLERVAGPRWASMLGLPDPDSAGTRRVADALSWLAKAQLIQVARQPGSPPSVTLLDPAGSGAAYTRPTGQYVTLPIGFWRHQWITKLSGSATALLLVLLDLQGGRRSSKDAPFVPADLRRRYGLSGDTWTRATRELVDTGLLDVGRQPQGNVFDWQRLRNTYWIQKPRLDEDGDFELWTASVTVDDSPGVTV